MQNEDIWEAQETEQKLQILASQISSTNPFETQSSQKQLRITTDSSADETYNFTNFTASQLSTEQGLISPPPGAHYPSTIPSVGSDTRPEASIQADTEEELQTPEIKAEIKIVRSRVEQATQSPRLEEESSSPREEQSHNFVYTSFDVKLKESTFRPARLQEVGILPHSRPLTVIHKGQRNGKVDHTLHRSIRISKIAPKSNTLGPVSKYRETKEHRAGELKKVKDSQEKLAKVQRESQQDRKKGGEESLVSGKSSKESMHKHRVFQEPEFKLGASYTFDLREARARKERTRVFGKLNRIKERKFSKGLETMEFVKYPYFNSVRPFQWDSPSQILHSTSITRPSPFQQQTSPSHLVMKLSSTFTSKDVEEYLRQNRPSRPVTTHLRANGPLKLQQQLPNASVEIQSNAGGVFSRPLTSLDRASLRTSYKFRPGALITGSVTPTTAQFRRGKRAVGKRKGTHFLQTKIIGSPISLAAREELRDSITGHITREDMRREGGTMPPRIPLPLPPPPPPPYADSIERWENFESDAEQDSIQRFVEKRKYMQRYMQSESQSSAEAAFETELTPKLDYTGGGVLEGLSAPRKKKQQKQVREIEQQTPQTIKEEPEKFRTAATYTITFSKDVTQEGLQAEAAKKGAAEMKRELATPVHREMKPLTINTSKSPRSAHSGPISPRAIKAIRQSGKMNIRGIKPKREGRMKDAGKREKLRFSIERAQESSAVITEHTEVKDQCVGEDTWVEDERLSTTELVV